MLIGPALDMIHIYVYIHMIPCRGRDDALRADVHLLLDWFAPRDSLRAMLG